jgi:hypothetical protein
MEFGGGNPPEDPPHPAIDVTTAIVGASHAVATMIILAAESSCGPSLAKHIQKAKTSEAEASA